MKQLGFGTAAIGRPHYINIRDSENNFNSIEDFKNQGAQLVERAYQKGIRYFDTAPGYGIAEEILADWLKTKKDNSIEIATKWGYIYTANFDVSATTHEIKDHSLKNLKVQWSESRSLLPFLTTYQIHSATFETGVLKNMEVLHFLAQLKSDHHLKIGLTTSGANQLDVLKFGADVINDGIQLFDAFQVTYNVFDQSLYSFSNELIKNGKRIIIKEALANGRVFKNDRYPHYSSFYSAVQNMAEKYEVGTDAIALRFCIDTLQPYSVLSGASTSPQLDQNLHVDNFQLDPEEIVLLKSFAVNPEAYWKERKQLGWN